MQLYYCKEGQKVRQEDIPFANAIARGRLSQTFNVSYWGSDGLCALCLCSWFLLQISIATASCKTMYCFMIAIMKPP